MGGCEHLGESRWPSEAHAERIEMREPVNFTVNVKEPKVKCRFIGAGAVRDSGKILQ